MSDPLLVDDHLLLRLLLDDEPPSLRPRGAELFTTGLWYHRLCRALSNPTVIGALSSRLNAVAGNVASEAIVSVTELPDSIGLLSLRTLGWPMAKLVSAGARLNLLSLEALAAATHLQAEICLAPADHNRPLHQHAAQHNLPVRVIAD